jgi:hypothetical protein
MAKTDLFADSPVPVDPPVEDAPVKDAPPVVDEVPADPPQETQVEVDEVPEPVVKLVIAPDADVTYPITVGLAAGDYTFESASDSFDVHPDVAASVEFVPQVTTEAVA